MNRLLTLIFLMNMTQLLAQEPMRVIRSAAVDRNVPIRNIYIDENNNKWVGNSKGVYQVHSVDYATEVEIGDDELSLLSLKGGNFNLKYSKSALLQILKDQTDGLFEGERDFAGAFYDPVQKEIWVGTKGIGVFRIKVEPTIQLLEHLDISNSKLKTDFITVMFSDKPGSYWIGTEEGVMHNEDGKWKLFEKLVKIEAIEKSGSDVWVFGEGWLWKVDAANKWTEIDLDNSMVEGKINDIALDNKGNMWIASEVITRFHLESGTFDKFGAAEYFTSNIPTSLSVDQEGAIWVGTEDKGLYLIEKESAITVNCLIEKELSCDGKNDAELRVIVSGGEAPFSYDWKSGLQGENPKGLGPGIYEVTVTDKKGKKRSATATIENPGLTLKVNQDRIESAALANDGAATVTVTGGQPGYKFLWDNGETQASAVKLNEGQHSVTVTDQKGCSAIANVIISRQVEAISLSITQDGKNKCFGDKSASLSLEIKGGKGPYQTTWSVPEIKGERPTGLAAGKYQVTITDAQNNTTSKEFVVTEPEVLSTAITIESPASTGNSDGKANAKATGGTAPYTFKWDTGETLASATKLGTGVRTLTVTDASGCSATATVTIDENILPLSVSIEQTSQIKCFGEKGAALEVKVNGGKGPFQYQWSSAGLSGNQTMNLASGEYFVTLTDAEGTTKVGNIKIKEPEALSATITVESPASTGNSDGKASAKATGGTAPYTFKWDTGETLASASKLGPGVRTLTVTDASGCSATATVAIDENILPLSVSIEQTSQIKCFGEKGAALEVKVNGGKGPFQYRWSSADLSGNQTMNLTSGEYFVTLTDAEGTTKVGNFKIKEPEALAANITVESPASTGNSDGKASAKATGGTAPYTFKWDTGEALATASKLGPGLRTLTVTDASGCSATATVTIDENILPLSVSIDQTAQIKCFGDKGAALEVKVNGGKGPFQYQWSSADLSGNQTMNLASGEYFVTLTDAEGTTKVGNIKIKEPEALSATITVESPASTGNSDGKASVKATGGTAPYSFKWDTGETLASASKLGPGLRTLTVTDASGCSATATVTIDENILPLSVSIEQTSQIKCFGEKGAALEVKVNGGKGPFQYQWNTAGLDDARVSNLNAGEYVVTVTDVEGSSKIAEIKIKEPAVLTAEISSKNPASFEDTEDGKAEIEAKGGAGNYTFRWDNNENGSKATKLGIGNHSVTVSDENGCNVILPFETKKRILPELTAATLKAGQTVKMEELFFEADSFRITNISLPVIEELYDFMKENGSVVIEVGGHTNNIPEHDFCDKLSNARAKSIADYIVQKGIDPKRVYYKGYGKRKPVATNETAEGRMKNQRVEIKIISI